MNEEEIDDGERTGTRTEKTCRRCDGYGSVILGHGDGQHVENCWGCQGTGERPMTLAICPRCQRTTTLGKSGLCAQCENETGGRYG